ncbi:YSC84-related protein [Acidimangrovimonas sediminis]|uniref:YSC84-related protein n=1 Tax=Acidimangrovimonas sediminis TaxID=2056283 RepID=UPI000C80234C|nr:YSC84-related protein [Acidimangrovimonas sediminis]
MTTRIRPLTAGAAATLMGVLALGASPALAMTHAQGLKARPKLDARVESALQHCATLDTSCKSVASNSAAVLVFPDVTTVDLGIGGSGGAGALIENGKIQGYYDVGKASVGFQLGAKQASQVYVFPTKKSVSKIRQGGEWHVGAGAGITVVRANATANAETGKPRVYVFDSAGLNGGAKVSALKIWKDNS